MLWDEFNHQSEVSPSIIKISGNTSVGFLTRYLQTEPILREYLRFYINANPDRLFEQSFHYQKLFWEYGWNVSELIGFLQTFHTQKLCWILHERGSEINTTGINPGNCQNKFGNPCCMHPEENGIFYALIVANHILRACGKQSIHPDDLWITLWNIGWLDADVQRESSRMWVIKVMFNIIWKEPKDRVRDYAIKEQKLIGSRIQWYNEILISGLQGLIDSEATLPNASQPQGKPLPQVDLARIL